MGVMDCWRRFIAAVIGACCATVAVHADMTPVSQLDHLDAVCGQSVSVCAAADLRQINSSSSPFAGLSVVGLNSWPVEFLPGASAGPSQISEIQHPHSLTSGQSSLSLCLSALIGLGLCSSAHCVRKLHFGSIPEWYHHGGPAQIGHSFVVNPDSVCPVPACCFAQPVHTAEDITPQYRSGTVVSLWRKSQFTPETIAARGPPMTS